MKRPPLILVVGMHRSGTSLLGSILNALGVSLPGPLIPGDHNNLAGYFERSDITALQEELLIDLERWWPSEQGTWPLPEGWLKTPRAERASSCLKRLLKVDQELQRGPWAIKDPRSSLLLPLWRQVAAELDLPLRVLLAFRDPAEVVTSLVTRDAASTGMTVERAQSLWIRHQQQLLLDIGDLPLHVVSYSRWFDSPQNQIQALKQFCFQDAVDTTTLENTLTCIRPDYRRSQSHPQTLRLNWSVKRWHKRLELAAAGGSLQTLQTWAAQRPKREAQERDGKQPATPKQHPWSRAMSALGSSAPASQKAGIQAWERHGIAPNSFTQLRALNHPGFPGFDPSANDGGELPQKLWLAIIGGSLEAWTTHLWINHLPLSNGCTVMHCTPEAATQAVLHLQCLELTAQSPELLLHLSRVQRVFDPDPEQVRLLRLLGVNAEPLKGRMTTESKPPSVWFNSNKVSLHATAHLGLPNPKALMRLGGEWLCLGSNGDNIGWQTLPVSLLHLPVFPPAPALSQQKAFLLAGWINNCLVQGLKLVRLNPDATELFLWGSLKVPCFKSPIDPVELLEELAWLDTQQLQPTEVHTPTPAAELIWEHSNGLPPKAAICISSFNYSKRILEALESCFAQSLQAVELLIVDDASTDNSLSRCREWLQANGHRFYRVLLLKHSNNSGLAAARNTAFASAKSPWCWVLDADNQMDSRALEQCLLLAEASDENVGVVHPLIRVVSEAGEQLGLVGGGHAWQKEQLRNGNMIDAMALIRKSAWLTVGGYSHIPGGWEDFDFWCKLIDANLHGVLCPQVLATYCLHGDSMLQSQTNQRQRRLSRLLQARHPWLQLAYAQSDF